MNPYERFPYSSELLPETVTDSVGSYCTEGLLQADSLFVAGEANLRAISHWAPTSP